MPEPPPPVPPTPILSPRTGRGVCWSDVVAEIKQDEEERQSRPPTPVQPWTPEPAVHTTPAGDEVQVQPAEPTRSPWFLRRAS